MPAGSFVLLGDPCEQSCAARRRNVNAQQLFAIDQFCCVEEINKLIEKAEPGLPSHPAIDAWPLSPF